MAYTDDSVKAKLSALNETQESIVTVAQWIMFHRRHADRTGQLWLERLKESGAGKRLNLIYLANEVVQQSKARKKDDFLISFSPIVAEAVATAYKGATTEIQLKVRRVVEVWRQRQIFEIPIQDSVEARITEIDKSRSGGKKSLMGGNIFSNSSGPSAPAELQPLVPKQIAVAKASLNLSTTKANANTEWEKLMDSTEPTPSPPVHAARLSSLLKTLANAEGAVSESIKARRDLIGGLEKLLETNRKTLNHEEVEHQELVTRKASAEAKKREVEDGIMRGLSSEASNTPFRDGTEGAEATGDRGSSIEPERPTMEELTPPPMESITPIGSPKPFVSPEPDEVPQNAFAAMQQALAQREDEPAVPAGSDLLASLSMPAGYGYAANTTNGGTYKKRKLESGDGSGGLDDDVAELLRAESGNG